MDKREEKLCEKIGYGFKDISILENALTHSSYANENHAKHGHSNERLEFLGDSVLSIMVSEYLYKHYYNMPEGELTKIRSNVVCERSLYERAKELDLGAFLYLGRGEEATNGRSRTSILADAYEALMGAVYLDGGLSAVRHVFMPRFIEPIKKAATGKSLKDYKTMLQEIVQKNKEEVLSYELKSESGPDHLKVFEVDVMLNNNVFASGRGRSKKEAQQDAARLALVLMGEIKQ
ncbi:MAG: ribonuclease III [Clostridia bacterium]|nr:ribonuclease III [Clostridia bacterium]